MALAVGITYSTRDPYPVTADDGRLHTFGTGEEPPDVRWSRHS
jgi:hypothetical protein